MKYFFVSFSYNDRYGQGMANANMPANQMPTLREIKAAIAEIVPGARNIIVLCVAEMSKEDIDKLFSEK